MKKKLLRRSVAMAAAISLILSNTANAGTWYQNTGNWFVKDEKSGKNLTGWYQDDKRDWYYLEPSKEGKFNGALRSGWLPSGNDWFFLNPVHDGSFGKMFANTWVWIDGYCYYFDASGKMLSGTKTPDGYTVNRNGQWTENGVIQYVTGKGIITKKSNIDTGSSDADSSSGSQGGTGNNGNGSEGSDTGKQQVTLTIKYMDADTNEILDTRVLSGKTGESAKLEHLEIGGYTIVDNQPISAVFAAKNTEVYVLYRKVLLSGEIIIRYVDCENNQVIAVNTVSGRIDDTYIVHVPVIDGYKAMTDEDQIVTFTAAQQTATVEYRPIRENETPDQRIVPSSRLKVAKADNDENAEILSQMYREIFDYQNNEDGTIDLAVNKDNPILEYIENGRFTTNDVVSLDPTEEFPTGLTFIYQSHDDNYSGEYESEYDAEEYEVIHAWQATAFSMYAPGTEIDVEIPVISEDLLTLNSKWVADDENTNEVFACAEDIATYAASDDDSSTEDITFKIQNGKWEKKVELASGNLGTIESELKASYEAGFGAKKLVIKIHIPFLKETDIITKKKYCEFKFEPLLKSTVNVGVKTSAEYGAGIPVLEEISQNRQNKVGIKGFAIQGLDFENLGLYPFAAQGYNFVLNTWNFNAKDILANEDGAIDESSLSVYIGAVESLVFRMAGSIELKDSFEFTMADVVMGIRIEKKDGKYTPENLSKVKSPSFKLTSEGKASVDNLDTGISFMPMASVSGVIPVGIELQGGLTFSDSEVSVKAKLEAGGDLEKPKFTHKAKGKAALSAYVEITGHIRMAAEFGEDEDQIELISKDLSILKRKTWPILKGTFGYIEGDTAITVYNWQDEFRVSNNEADDLKKSVNPVLNEKTNQYEFDCPAYILRQNNKWEDKGYRVTRLLINVPAGAVKNTWEKLMLPSTLKELTIDQIVAENFKCNFATAVDLEKLYMNYPGTNNQFKELDLSANTKLKDINISSEKLEKLILPGGDHLDSLKVDGRDGDSFKEFSNLEYANLRLLQISKAALKEIDTTKLPGLQILRIQSTPIETIDLSKNKGLKELKLESTEIKNLDVSENENLETLSVSATLKTFTGNGKVMPDVKKQKWYLDSDRTQKIPEGYMCPKGTTIYSSIPKNVEVTEIYPKYNGCLEIKPGVTYYRPADKYGNDISDEWEEYYVPERKAVTAKLGMEYSYRAYDVKLPQYILERDSWGNEKCYKLRGVILPYGYSYGLIDGSEAPDLEELWRYNGTGGFTAEIILPAGLKKLFSGDLWDSNFKCDFSRAPELEEIELRCIGAENVHYDFSKNIKLKKLILETNVPNVKTFKIDLPESGTLEELEISHTAENDEREEGFIDFSKSPNLKSIYFDGLMEKELDLTSLKKLENLTLKNMTIEKLNTDENQNLKVLKLEKVTLENELQIQITKLNELLLDGIEQDEFDFTKLSELQRLYLYNMSIKEIDISKNIKLQGLYLKNLPNFKHLDVSKNLNLSLYDSNVPLRTFKANGRTRPQEQSWYTTPEKNYSDRVKYDFEFKLGQTYYSFYYDPEEDNVSTVEQFDSRDVEESNNIIVSTDSNAQKVEK